MEIVEIVGLVDSGQLGVSKDAPRVAQPQAQRHPAGRDGRHKGRKRTQECCEINPCQCTLVSKLTRVALSGTYPAQVSGDLRMRTCGGMRLLYTILRFIHGLPL